jgi:hypothetical protein
VKDSTNQTKNKPKKKKGKKMFAVDWSKEFSSPKFQSLSLPAYTD